VPRRWATTRRWTSPRAGGTFELSVYWPAIAFDLLDIVRELADAMVSFGAHCIGDVEVDAQRAEPMSANSLMGVTALVPCIGHGGASQIARDAHAQGLP
jgi:fumarate hydratase, class II